LVGGAGYGMVGMIGVWQSPGMGYGKRLQGVLVYILIVPESFLTNGIYVVAFVITAAKLANANIKITSRMIFCRFITFISPKSF
jgi:hypothetical protein